MRYVNQRTSAAAIHSLAEKNRGLAGRLLMSIEDVKIERI